LRVIRFAEAKSDLLVKVRVKRRPLTVIPPKYRAFFRSGNNYATLPSFSPAEEEKGC
jgi:hypothetical protein